MTSSRALSDRAREFMGSIPVLKRSYWNLEAELVAFLTSIRDEATALENEACMVLAATFAHVSHGSLPATPRECQTQIAHEIAKAIRARRDGNE